MAARGGHVPDVELERFEAAERAARETRHDVEPIALVDDLGDVRAAEGDPVEHVQVPPQRQLAVSAVRGADPRDRHPEHGNAGVGIARAARCEAGQLAVQAVVDVPRGEGQVDRDRAARVGRGGGRGELQEALAE